MTSNLLTNYNIKFSKTQLDLGTISKQKLSYNIYNNKISEPLHRFWFSISNVKYSNNYDNFKTMRFLLNDKNPQITNMIKYIKDIGNYLSELYSETFPNLTVEYPWKESKNYPLVLSVFTSSNTMILDSNSTVIDYDNIDTTFTSNQTYSMIFEISNIRIIPIKMNTDETHILKINLSLVLIKKDEKKDLTKFVFEQYNSDECEYSSNSFSNSNNKYDNVSSNKVLNSSGYPFPKMSSLLLSDISQGVNKKLNGSTTTQTPTPYDFDKNNQNKNEITNTGSFVINKEQLLQIKNTLKKVELIKENNDNEDNMTSVKEDYINKKNNLKKVNTEERTLLTHLKLKKKKKKSSKKINIGGSDDLEKELEKELERELERKLENNL